MKVLIDKKRYTTKPELFEFGAITNRLKKTEPSDVTEAELCEALRRGQTICGCFTYWSDEPDKLQVFGLDFDNAVEVEGTDDKRPLLPGEDGYIEPIEVMNRCIAHGLEPMAFHTTLSASPDNLRFHVLFDLGEPVEDDVITGVIETLLDLFPEADPKCSNRNRLFCGSQGRVCEVWRYGNV